MGSATNARLRKMTSSRETRAIQVAGLMNHFWLVLFSEDNLRQAAGLRYISHMGDNSHTGISGTPDMRGYMSLIFSERKLWMATTGWQNS